MIAFSQQTLPGTSDPNAAAPGAGASDANAVDRLIVVFRNDDPSAESEVAHERRINELFERYGVPQTIGVIPNCTVGDRHDPRPCGERALDQNPAMVAELRRHCAAVGSEIALHGYTHRTSPRSMPKRREYFEFRDESAAAQAEKLTAGIAIIERALGVRPVTFIPPWNRMDTATARACQQTGLTIASSGVYTPVVDGVIGLGTDCDLFNFPEFFERALRSDRRVYLRILFHSRTTRTAEEIAALERALQLVTQTPGCKAMTLAGAVERYRDEIRVVNDAGRNAAPQDMLYDSPRAMAVPVRRLIRTVGLSDPVAGVLAQAEAALRDGRYELAASVSARIDRSVLGVLVGWYLTLFLMSGLASAGLTWFMRTMSASERVLLPAVYCVVGGIVGVGLRRRAVTRAAVLQCYQSTFVLVLGMAMGFVAVTELLGLPH